jgi:hypothetical protein
MIWIKPEQTHPYVRLQRRTGKGCSQRKTAPDTGRWRITASSYRAAKKSAEYFLEVIPAIEDQAPSYTRNRRSAHLLT